MFRTSVHYFYFPTCDGLKTRLELSRVKLCRDDPKENKNLEDKKQINKYIYIYNLHGLSCQEKVSRFSMLLIPRYGTSLAVSHWKLRMVLMIEYRSSRLDQNKPFSGPVSTLLSSSADFTVSACPVAYALLDLLH